MTRLDAITLRQLRALSALVASGTLAGAGDQLGLSAPAIHAQIRNLEAAMGAPLLARGAGGPALGAQLTPEGQAVLETARRIEIALGQCAAQITALTQGHAGRVVLGVVSTAKYFAPRLVARLKQLCPEIAVVLRETNREGIIADLERHAVDLAVMGRPPRHPEVEAVVLGPHPHGLVAPPDHPLARQGSVSVDDLLRETMITREEGSGTRILMTRYLDSQAEGRVFDLVEMGSNETIKQAVMAGLGLAFLSLHTVTDELAQGRLVALAAPGLPLERQWFLVRPQHLALGPAAARLQDQILALSGSFLPRPDRPRPEAPPKPSS